MSAAARIRPKFAGRRCKPVNSTCWSSFSCLREAAQIVQRIAAADDRRSRNRHGSGRREGDERSQEIVDAVLRVQAADIDENPLLHSAKSLAGRWRCAIGSDSGRCARRRPCRLSAAAIDLDSSCRSRWSQSSRGPISDCPIQTIAARSPQYRGARRSETIELGAEIVMVEDVISYQAVAREVPPATACRVGCAHG